MTLENKKIKLVFVAIKFEKKTLTRIKVVVKEWREGDTYEI